MWERMDCWILSWGLLYLRRMQMLWKVFMTPIFFQLEQVRLKAFLKSKDTFYFPKWASKSNLTKSKIHEVELTLCGTGKPPPPPLSTPPLLWFWPRCPCHVGWHLVHYFDLLKSNPIYLMQAAGVVLNLWFWGFTGSLNQSILDSCKLKTLVFTQVPLPGQADWKNCVLHKSHGLDELIDLSGSKYM